MRARINSSLLTLILSMGLYSYLSIAGIKYGLPDSSHILSYACDETIWLESLSKLNPSKLDFNPFPFLTHPSMYLQMYAAGVFAAAKVGWIPLSAGKEWFLHHPDIFARFYLVGRYIQVICGLGLLLLTWFVSKRVFNERTANWATLFLAICPALIATSHFSQASLPVTFFGFASLASLLLGISERRYVNAFFYGGSFFAGVAIGTKLSALALFAPMAFYAWHFRLPLRYWLLGGLALFAGFAVSCPYALIDPKSFWEALHMHIVDNQLPIASWAHKIIFPFRISYRFSFGIPLMCLTLAGCAYAFKKISTPAIQLLLVWILGFFLALLRVGEMGTSPRVLIIVPAMLILTGVFIDEMSSRFSTYKNLINLILLLVVVTTLWHSLAIDAFRKQSPLQKDASAWLETNVPRSKSIGIPRDPFWFSPDTVTQSYYWPERLTSPYRVVNFNYSLEQAQKEKPDYFVLSEIEKVRCSAWPTYPKACQELVTWLENGGDYEVAQKFERKVSFMGIEWNRPEYKEYPTYDDDDLKATSIWIYKRKDGI